MAQETIARVWAQGLQPTGVVADEVYGHEYKFRAGLEAHQQPYVVAVPATQSVTVELSKLPIRSLLARVPRWRKLSAGTGTKGPRIYEWAGIPLNHPYGTSWQRVALFRRSLSDPEELAYYLVFARAGTSLRPMVQAAWS